MKPTPGKTNPFPGLRPFTQEEDYLFFGREEQTLELLQRLGSNRFVAVVGTSGSGKSSLVRCGLLSELLGGRMLEAGAAWEIAVTHPGGNPLALLAESLLDADIYDREQDDARENLLATLSRSHFGLVEAVKQADLGEGTNFLLVVDQFEEVFRFHEAGLRQQEAANEFVSLLLEAAAQKEVPIYVVLTMRSDFIGECGQFEGLAEMVNRGEFLIPRLTRDQFKRVIEGPIKVAGGQIAPRLLQRLLNDLGQQADQLPCLQHALMRTWDVWAAKGDADALDLDDYQRVGRMSQALSLHADEIYDSLADDRQRELCRGIFQALTVEESNSRGIRRPQRLGRLCQILEVPADELVPIIDAYRQSGVTFLMPSPEVELTDQTIIDISHESLMRVWVRLRQWVEEETQAAGIYHRLAESADLHDHGKAGLYRDPELGIALAWQEAKRPNAAWAERYRPGFAAAMAFLEASREASTAEEQAREAAQRHELEQAQQLAEAQQLRLEHQQRAARRLRSMIGGLAAVAAVAGLACIVALFANGRANRLAEKARQNEEKATQNAVRAEESRKETAKVLAVVESQKNEIQSSLTKAQEAEEAAKAAEEAGRRLLYTTDLKLAPFVWRDDRTTAEQLRTLLTKHVPQGPAAAEKLDLRGFEWHYYQHLLENSAIVFSGHAAPVLFGGFASADELVTLDDEGQVRRWNLNSRSEEQAARLDLPAAASALVRTLSPDGRLTAWAAGNEVHVTECSTGKELWRIGSANVRARGLIFSPDGSRLVILDDKIRWCDAASGQEIGVLNQNIDIHRSLALSADGLTLAVVGHSTTSNLFSVFRLNPATKTVAPMAKDAGVGGTMQASAMSPDGRLLAVGLSLSGSLYIFDTMRGNPVAAHRSAHASPISAITLASDGSRMATADDEGMVKIWASVRTINSKTSAAVSLKGHQGQVHSLGFSSDGTHLFTTGADKTARVWEADASGASIRQLGFASSPYVARFSPTGRWIALGEAGGIGLWDASTGSLVRTLSLNNTDHSFSVAFCPTDPRLLAVGFGGEADISHVALWDIDSRTELARLPGAADLPNFPLNENSGAVGALAFSPDGKYLVAGFGAKNMYAGVTRPTPLKVWDVSTRQLVRRLSGHTGYCMAIAFAPDGSHFVSANRDGTAIVWSTATWKPVQTLRNPERDTLYPQGAQPGMFEDVAFSPDGKTIALASREGTVQLWDAVSGQHLASLEGHSSAVTAVAFSPDGRTLVSGSVDHTVRLWNVLTRNELMQLDAGNLELGQLRTLAFSPDGTKVVAGGDIAAVWSAAPAVWNDADRAAQELRAILPTSADFPSQIRMLSEHLELPSALAKLDPSDKRVQAALAATEANWHASRQQWPAAVAAFDRLPAADAGTADQWLRAAGLLRVATALVHEGRHREAAALLTGGAIRRGEDGYMYSVTNSASLGLMFSSVEGQVRISRLFPNSPAQKSALQIGDTIVKVNDIELTSEYSLSAVSKLLSGDVAATLKLTVRHASSGELEVVELKRERFLSDVETGEQLHPLRIAIDQRLAEQPSDPALLELRAELAGQWSDTKAQVADYTAAIEALRAQNSETAAADLLRLYARRGNAHVALQQWSEAASDYGRTVTAETTDESLLANQALAVANSILKRSTDPIWTVLKPATATTEKGTALALQEDGVVLLAAQTDTAPDAIRWQPGSAPPQALRIETSSKPLTSANRSAPFSEYQIIAASMATPTGALRGRFVRLDLPGDNRQFPRYTDDQEKKYINLAELQVFQGEQNIALAKKATSSSGDGRLAPEGAVDGNTVGNDDGNPYAHTWDPDNPWWEVDLGSEQTIDRMVVWNRSDVTLFPRMNHFRIRVLDRSRRVVFEQVVDQAPTPSREILRPVLISDPASAASEGDQPLVVRLPEQTPLRVRVSAAADLADLRVVEEIQLDDPWQKLASAYLDLDNQQAINQLAERHPARAGQIGDVFVLRPNKDWARAVEIYSRGITDKGADADLLAKRATAYEALQQWDAAAADWSRAAQGNPGGAKILSDFAHRLTAANPAALAETKFTEAQSLYEQALQADPENDVVASELAQLLLHRHELRVASGWTVLQTAEMNSERGATLTLQPDGSILASGNNVDGDIYKISSASSGAGIAAIRLEVMPDASLPSQGPGRHPSGNFHLRAFRLYQSAGDGSMAPIPVAVARAKASYQWDATDTDVTGTIDESLKKFWHVWGQLGKPHQAVFVLQEPLVGQNRPLVIELRQNHPLGRFRLSAIADSALLESDERKSAVEATAEPWLKLAGSYALSGRNDLATHYFDFALAGATDHEARQSAIDLVSQFDDVLDALAERHRDDPQVELALARKLAERGQKLLAANKLQQAQIELERSHQVYTRLRIAAPQSPWTVLTPTELLAKGGETLTVENDGSVLVSGPNPQRAVYTLHAPVSLPTVAAIRLETIPDARLPDGGAGRFGNGNFHLAEVSAALHSASSTGSGSRAVKLEFSSAIGDAPESGNNVAAKSIDGNARTYWDTHPATKRPHWAILGLRSPAKSSGSELIITLDAGVASWGEHGLGRFRLSVTDDPQAIERARNGTDVKESEFVDLSLTLAKVYARQNRPAEAVHALQEALQLATDRASKAKIIAQAAQVAGALEQLTAAATGDRLFLTELAQHYSEQQNTALAAAVRRQARALIEQQLAKDSENANLAKELADLLLQDTIGWTVLTPIEPTAKSGIALTVQSDQSVLAEGKYEMKDRFTVNVQGVPPGIRAIRLEAMRDERLPSGGPGTYPEGQFVLSEFKLLRPDETAPSAMRALFLKGACATHEERPVRALIEPDENGWSIAGEYGRSHAACFEVAPSGAGAPSDRLQFVLDFQHQPNSKQAAVLGRFRLSVSTDPAAYRMEQRRFAALKLTDPWQRLAAAYVITSDQAALAGLLNRRPQIAATVADLYAADRDWERAIAQYSLLITPETNDAELLAKRAQAYEKAGQWERAIDDWTRASLIQPDIAFRRFKSGSADSWRFQPQYGGTGSIEVVGNELVLTTTNSTGTDWHVKALQSRLQLENGAQYVVRFQMKSPDLCPVTLAGNIDQADFRGIGLSEKLLPTAEYEQYEVTFVARNAIPQNNRIGIYFGAKVGQVVVKQFVILKKTEGANLYAARGIDLALEGKTDEAMADLAEALKLGTDRATKAKIISVVAPLAGALETLTEVSAADSEFQVELASYYAQQGNGALADGARQRARMILQARLAKTPTNVALARELTDLLLVMPEGTHLVPTSESEGVKWLMTTTQPAGNWMNEDFDARAWTEAIGGFGSGAEGLRTTWKTGDIWLRRTFEWQPSDTDRKLILRHMHDDEAEVYLNGRHIAKLTGWNWGYVTLPLDSVAAQSLHAGTNTIAVHCHQNDGGQLIDVGLTELPLSAGRLKQITTAMNLTDPWEKLAGAYVIYGDREALGVLLKAHPKAATVVADLYAADGDWELAVEQYDKLITAETTDASLLARRASANLGAKQWEAALVDWKRAIQLQPDLLKRAFDELKGANRWSDAIPLGKQLVELKRDDSIEWLRVVPLYLLAGDETGYAEYCSQMAAQFAGSSKLEDSERVTKAALLRAGAFDSEKLPVALFAQSLDDGTAPEGILTWFWGTRALVAYRSGNAEGAVKYVARSEEFKPLDAAKAFNLAVLAMAQHQLGHRDEAKAVLEELSQLVARLQAGDLSNENHDNLIARILLHEAESRIAVRIDRE